MERQKIEYRSKNKSGTVSFIMDTEHSASIKVLSLSMILRIVFAGITSKNIEKTSIKLIHLHIQTRKQSSKQKYYSQRCFLYCRLEHSTGCRFVFSYIQHNTEGLIPDVLLAIVLVLYFIIFCLWLCSYKFKNLELFHVQLLSKLFADIPVNVVFEIWARWLHLTYKTPLRHQVLRLNHVIKVLFFRLFLWHSDPEILRL